MLVRRYYGLYSMSVHSVCFHSFFALIGLDKSASECLENPLFILLVFRLPSPRCRRGKCPNPGSGPRDHAMIFVNFFGRYGSASASLFAPSNLFEVAKNLVRNGFGFLLEASDCNMRLRWLLESLTSCLQHALRIAKPPKKEQNPSQHLSEILTVRIEWKLWGRSKDLPQYRAKRNYSRRLRIFPVNVPCEQQREKAFPVSE